MSPDVDIRIVKQCEPKPATQFHFSAWLLSTVRCTNQDGTVDRGIRGNVPSDLCQEPMPAEYQRSCLLPSMHRVDLRKPSTKSKWAELVPTGISCSPSHRQSWHTKDCAPMEASNAFRIPFLQSAIELATAQQAPACSSNIQICKLGSVRIRRSTPSDTLEAPPPFRLPLQKTFQLINLQSLLKCEKRLLLDARACISYRF